MQSGADEFYQAVYFIDRGRVQRAMRLSEFEACLDGYVGLSDLKGTEVKAVYAQISGGLGVRALLFFRIGFDDEGRADSQWNIPLQNLVDQASSGPDLGEGPIRLVCRSRCPDQSFTAMLWDPSMSPDNNEFQLLRKAVEDNRLHFSRREQVAAEEIPVLTQRAPDDDSRQQRVRLARLLRQQRLHIKTLQSAHRDATRELQRQHRQELKELNRGQLQLEQQLERLQRSNAELQARLKERNSQYLELQRQLSAGDADESRASRMEAVLLREQLERKEREAEQREAQLAELQARLARQSDSEEGFLARLREQSVMLVVYHPGVGHLTLPYDEVPAYFANPMAYAAERCGIPQRAYEQWLAHYQEPVCQEGSGHALCGEPLLRVPDPEEFTPGMDDRCARHRAPTSH